MQDKILHLNNVHLALKYVLAWKLKSSNAEKLYQLCKCMSVQKLAQELVQKTAGFFAWKYGSWLEKEHCTNNAHAPVLWRDCFLN